MNKGAAAENVDVSCLMLFEATGDSEIDGVEEGILEEEDEDDAESCSYGSYSYGCECMKKIGSDFDQRPVEVYCMEEYEDDEEVENDEQGKVVEQYSAAAGGGGGQVVAQPNSSEESVVAEKFKKSNEVCENPNLKMMNQRDRDRLFWEACLAS